MCPRCGARAIGTSDVHRGSSSRGRNWRPVSPRVRVRLRSSAPTVVVGPGWMVRIDCGWPDWRPPQGACLRMAGLPVHHTRKWRRYLDGPSARRLLLRRGSASSHFCWQTGRLKPSSARRCGSTQYRALDRRRPYRPWQSPQSIRTARLAPSSSCLSRKCFAPGRAQGRPAIRKVPLRACSEGKAQSERRAAQARRISGSLLSMPKS